MTLQELREEISGVEIGVYPDSAYYKLYNTMEQIWETNNNHPDGAIEDPLGEKYFDDFITHDAAQETAVEIIENQGLQEAKWYLEDIKDFSQEVFKNAYGGLVNVDRSDMEELKYELLCVIDEAIKEEEV